MSADTAAHVTGPVAGVPTARRIDHFALTVPDLDAAVGYTVDVLGGELVYRLPPLAHDDDWMREHLDVHPRAAAEIALVRLGPTTNLELFRYTAPDHVARPPRPHDPGAPHFGLYADDVDAALAALRARGHGHALGPVRTADVPGPSAGARWVRVRTPLGVPLELRSTPPHAPGAARRHTHAGPWTNRDDGTAAPRALPTVRGVDHLTYGVADLDAAEDFFVRVLGAEPLGRTAYDLTDPSLAAALGVPAGGVLHRSALRAGPTDNIELDCYQGLPGARARRPRNSDVGGSHLALYVDDVDAAAAYLAAHPGCEVLGGPETIDEGPLAGDRWVYVRTAVGLYVEVVRMPDGELPYERGTAARRRAAHGLRWRDR
ncbi:VOC family protein [Streptomyces sp. NPDC048737]|uniref:VOC family protein n=1 Tax=unclassified Streptomyces TaxID=2593676 RepID=UPI0034233A3A